MTVKSAEDLPKWKVHLDPKPRRSWVEVDGVRVPEVVAFSVQHEVGGLPRVTLTTLAGQVDVEGQGELIAIVGDEGPAP